MKFKGITRFALPVTLAIALSPLSSAQTPVSKVIIEIKTGDVTFAGTDDPIQLQIGGKPFNLDNPNKDDFERNNTDTFEFDTDPNQMTVELIRAVGILSVAKLEDSRFGGGWRFQGITVWVNNQSGAPIYQNAAVNRWLEDDYLVWTAQIDDSGWNFPPPPPEYPVCAIGNIDIGIKIDQDCDGIPDESDPTYDPKDSDGDGLLDGYEQTVSHTEPNNPDSDRDGWWDGNNRRSYLVLTRIRCLDEQEDVGRDEFYVTAEDIRYPVVQSLDGSWPLNHGGDIYPGAVVDSRVAAAPVAGGSALQYRTRLVLREGDITIAEAPTDDTLAETVLQWGEAGNFEAVYQADDAHYILNFVSFTVKFKDPTHDPMADADGDRISEAKEYLISVQDPSVQQPAVPGYNGLADPVRKDMFVEIDAVGGHNKLPFDAKQMVVTQFHNHNISLRMDDGYLGNMLPVLNYEETLTLAKLTGAEYRGNYTRFYPGRAGHYRYGLLADKVVGEGCFGVGSQSEKAFIVAHMRAACWKPDLGFTMIAQYTPIVLMHEMGHTMGLCHRAGDKPQQAPSSCPTLAPGVIRVGCARYCVSGPNTPIVGQDSTTAMGSDTTLDLLLEIFLTYGLVGALLGVGIALVAGGGIGAAFLAGLLGSLVGSSVGFGLSDAYARFPDYHWIEWSILLF